MNKKGASEPSRRRRASTRREALDETDIELRTLRKGAGLNRSKLRRKPLVLRLCGVSEDDPGAAYERIEAVVHAIPNDEVGTALRNALNIDSDWPNDLLEGRRSQLASRWNVSNDVVEARENEGFDELRVRLQTYTGLESTITEAEEEVLVRDRIIVRRWNRRVVKALSNGVQAYDYSLPLDDTVTALGGATWTLELSGPNYNVYEIDFGRELSLWEEHEFRFITDHTPEPDEAPDVVAAESFFSLTPRYHLKVRFEGARPEVVWQFTDRPRELIGVAPVGLSRRELLHIDERGEVSATFFNRQHGLACGIAWRWSEFNDLVIYG